MTNEQCERITREFRESQHYDKAFMDWLVDEIVRLRDENHDLQCRVKVEPVIDRFANPVDRKDRA